jgi:hypothetical protein
MKDQASATNTLEKKYWVITAAARASHLQLPAI